jgi:hypothetical protein
MRVTHAWIIGGLLGAVLGAVGLCACGHDAEDCRNTRTCPTPKCISDAGVDADRLEAGDCCEGEDGGLVCAQ